MCTSESCFGPDTVRFRVTRSDTGAWAEVWARTAEGAIKIANFPPAVCTVEVQTFIEMWVEADTPEE